MSYTWKYGNAFSARLCSNGRTIIYGEEYFTLPAKMQEDIRAYMQRKCKPDVDETEAKSKLNGHLAAKRAERKRQMKVKVW